MPKDSQKGFILNAITLIVIAVVLFTVLYRSFVAAPSNFPVPYRITVAPGESSSAISLQLAHDDAIKSRRTFQLMMKILGSDTHISPGDYFFDQPISTIDMALRISGKHFGISKIKVTFPEGYTDIQMTERLSTDFPHFDTAGFLELTTGQQGYLFPDTYKFFPTPQPQEVITAMKNNYEVKVAPLRPAIAASGHSEADIMVMASIIEKEAQGLGDSPVIAGILWKRIRNGMPLQVDADHTTYTHKGLPVKPIDNPGLVAIEAAVNPTDSPYLYYLHDSKGNVHYASTFQQHQQNIKKYLQ